MTVLIFLFFLFFSLHPFPAKLCIFSSYKYTLIGAAFSSHSIPTIQNMGNCFVGFFLFFALLVGHGIVELEASHHVFKNLQTVQSTASTNQPYRTGYHFQPPMNWINGICVSSPNKLSQFSFELSSFFAVLCFSMFSVLTLTSLAKVHFCMSNSLSSGFLFSFHLIYSDYGIDKWQPLDEQILMVSSFSCFLSFGPGFSLCPY